MRRPIVFLGCLVVATLAAPPFLHAQKEPAKPTQIVLRPAAAPTPAMKYQILPGHRTLVRGNAAIFYHRAVELTLESYAQMREQRVSKQKDASYTDEKTVVGWLAGPLSSIPQVEAKRWLEARQRALHEVELGARRQSCDWEYDERDEGVSLLIEEISEMRALIRIVSLKARVAVLEAKIDEAMHWIETGFAMARHCSQGPLLIQSLVGAHLSQMMCKPLEDVIQLPGAPSMYWALSHRPRPLTEFSTAIESERFLLEREIPSLASLDGPAWSVERGRQFATELQEKALKFAEIADRSETSGLREWMQKVGLAGLVLQVYPDAKRALIARGRSAEQVDSMPAIQVAVLHTYWQYEQVRDDIFKWTSLPFYQGYKGMEEAMTSVSSRGKTSVLLKLFTMLLPAVRSSGLALARSERHLDALQCIEAIRLHAALSGKLPSSLDEITEAPVPRDVGTGKPFEYRVEGDRATLRAPFPAGGLDVPQHRIAYELRLTR